MQIHPLITDSKHLAELCERLAQSPFVAVDTEFMRENTYYPDLCLVQLADANEAAAIDPKAEGLDMTPMLELLCNNEDVLKIFHAGGQDIEIFFNLTAIPVSRMSPSFWVASLNVPSSWVRRRSAVVSGSRTRASLVSFVKGAISNDWLPAVRPPVGPS